MIQSHLNPFTLEMVSRTWISRNVEPQCDSLFPTPKPPVDHLVSLVEHWINDHFLIIKDLSKVREAAICSLIHSFIQQ